MYIIGLRSRAQCLTPARERGRVRLTEKVERSNDRGDGQRKNREMAESKSDAVRNEKLKESKGMEK